MGLRLLPDGGVCRSRTSRAVLAAQPSSLSPGAASCAGLGTASAPSPWPAGLPPGSGRSGWGLQCSPLPASSARFPASRGLSARHQLLPVPPRARVRGWGPAAPAAPLPAGSDSSSSVPPRPPGVVGPFCPLGSLGPGWQSFTGTLCEAVGVALLSDWTLPDWAGEVCQLETSLLRVSWESFS